MKVNVRKSDTELIFRTLITMARFGGTVGKEDTKHQIYSPYNCGALRDPVVSDSFLAIWYSKRFQVHFIYCLPRPAISYLFKEPWFLLVREESSLLLGWPLD